MVCLWVSPPWDGTLIALPVNLRVRMKTDGKKTTELAAEMVAEVAGWLPARSLHLTGDGAYSSCSARSTTHPGHLPDAPGRRPCLSWRRRVPAIAIGPPSKAYGWEATRAGRRRTEQGLGHRHHRGARPQRRQAHHHLRRALVRRAQGRPGSPDRGPRPAGKEPDHFFVTTHLSASGAQVASRWPIECCFKEAKQHAGVKHPQSWKDQGPARAVMLTLGLDTAIWCDYLASWNNKPTWRTCPDTPARRPPASSTPWPPSPHPVNERITALS